MFPALPPIIGYAVTTRTIAARELATKHAASHADYWHFLEASTPKPRIAVVEDMDDPPSIGAFFFCQSPEFSAAGLAELMTRL
jgi:hypothetical protein